MTQDLPAALLAVHREAARTATPRDALEVATARLRSALDARWVLATAWDPVTMRSRFAVLDGIAGPAAPPLLRLATDPTIVTAALAAETRDIAQDLLRKEGDCTAAVALVLQEHDSDPLGLLVLGLDGAGPDETASCQIVATVTAELSRAVRAESETRRALYDAATGLPGPLLLDAVLQAADPDQEVALLLVSVDQLQTVSRSFGRAVGNEMLRKVAARLLVAGGAGAWSAYRLPRGLGVLTVGERGTAAAAAETILGAMQEPWQLGRRSVRSTCRIGVALRDDASTSADVLVERAEAALDAALARPRAGAVTYGREIAAHAHENLVLETLLQAALREGELVVRYQPQVDVADGGINGAEALVRWHRPSGVVTPDRFIPAAEATGVIVDIDRWVLSEACRQAARWVAQGRRPLRIACNVSSLTLATPGFAATVLAELTASGLAADLLEVEITETLSLFEGDDAVHELSVLRRHGVHVAIDDFGTGYSNVARLRQLPVDRVKIDQSFVRDIAGGDGAAICSVIVGLARTLDLDVIAEGVETTEQLAFLNDLGCREFQGYLASPPVEAADFELLLPT